MYRATQITVTALCQFTVERVVYSTAASLCSLDSCHKLTNKTLTKTSFVLKRLEFWPHVLL